MDWVFLGSNSPQSRATLHELGHLGCQPTQVFVHARSDPPAAIPVLSTHAGSLAECAAEQGLDTRALTPEALFSHLTTIHADGLLVSCYPQRLPEALLARFPAGCFNIHPAALPAWRGPSPVFWQLHAGLRHIGVSLHVMSTRLDAGPLIAQTRFAVPEHPSWAALHTTAGRLGARLWHRALNSAGHTPMVVDEHRASYQAAPCHEDFEVLPTWTCRHALAFIQGVAAIGYPWIRLPGKGPGRCMKRRIVSANNNTPAGESHRFRCADGLLALELE